MPHDHDAPAEGAAPQTIMLIRHGEKPDGGIQGVDYAGKDDPESLTPFGWSRAGALCHLFGSRDGLPTPTTIFASLEKGGDKGSLRPLQTICAYACLLNGIADQSGFYTKSPPATPKVPLDTRYDKKCLKGLADAVATTPGVVLVAWQHTEIAQICGLIGNSLTITNPQDIPQTWPGSRFDMVYVLTRGFAGYDFRQVPQLLLPGDSAILFPVTSGS